MQLHTEVTEAANGSDFINFTVQWEPQEQLSHVV